MLRSIYLVETEIIPVIGIDYVEACVYLTGKTFNNHSLN